MKESGTWVYDPSLLQHQARRGGHKPIALRFLQGLKPWKADLHARALGSMEPGTAKSRGKK
jgi:hypothetical protein